MDREIAHKIELCERADNAEWDENVVAAHGFTPDEKAYLHEHPPGLVGALWAHFDATRERCGCRTASHERQDCTVPLVEKLLLGGEPVS